ncbi:hypothetical protein KKF32_00730 [Patescibacteria group bacterium]|nr:hypothetical protein [Patescibacteria group bacterium]
MAKANKANLSVLYEENDIQKRIAEVAKKLANQFRAQNPLLLIVLKEGLFFAADLVRAMGIKQGQAFLSPTKDNHNYILIGANEDDIARRDIIIVMGIIDTGKTAEKVLKFLKDKKSVSVTIATLVNKSNHSSENLPPIYTCFECPGEKTVVGFGLSFRKKFFEKPFLATIENSAES